jgi:multidrug efflux pump
MASLLVMMIIIASLGIRQGLMVGASIPICFLIAFLMMNGMGVTLNMMVMFGMVLAVGILVDGGIVVVEYADRRMAEGLPKEEAFVAAGKRMFWPVANGTLTTLCAFVPFMFWNSIAGKFMSYLPLTLFFVLGASIFVALIFTPALGSIFARKAAVDEAHLAEIVKSEHGDPREMTGFMGWYARTLTYLGNHPTRSLGGGFVIVAAIMTWFPSSPRSSSRRAATSRPRRRTPWWLKSSVGSWASRAWSPSTSARAASRRTAGRTRRRTTRWAASASTSWTSRSASPWA